jgi:DNA-binding response OmpR family regulator
MDELRAHRPRILVAEDDAAMRQLLAVALRSEGYHVVAVHDSRELLEKLGSATLSHHGYDAIVSDIRMPGPSGLEVLRGLRAARDRTPVVLITAFGSEETHARAAEIGASAILDKPFALEDLLGLVAQLLPEAPAAAEAAAGSGAGH